jgi:hypothetical protein
MKKIRFLMIGLLVAVLAGVAASTVSAGNSWHGTRAQVATGGSRSIVRLWERGSDVIVTNEVTGHVTDQIRCESGVLTDFDVANNVAVVHADMSQSDCTRIASDPLRGASRMVKGGRFRVTASAVDQQGHPTTTYVPDDPSLPVIVLDDTTNLPVSVANGGQVTTFTYDQTDSATPPALTLDASTTYVEKYQAVTSTDLALAFKVKSLPMQFGDFSFTKSFTYDAGPTTGRAYYSIWQDRLNREVQLVLNTGVPSGGTQYGFTDDGPQVSFRVFEGDTCLQAFAPDLSALRAVVAKVRPGLAAQLEQEIAHPTAPQPKEAPTT